MDLEITDFQKRVLSTPQSLDLFLGGGRGGGKSTCLALLGLRYAEQYGQKARILYVRKTYKSLADFEQICRDLFGQLYGNKARFNATEGVWRLPNGAYFELGQLENESHFSKYLGRSFGLLLLDEITEYSSLNLLDRLRSNLRGPRDIPLRVVASGNPGGPSHMEVAKRYVFRDAKPWQPFLEENSGRQFVYCPSTYLQNDFIDKDQYRQQLSASCPNDEELLKAWEKGDWSVQRGAYFGSVLDEKRNCIDPIKGMPTTSGGFAKMKPGFTGQELIEHWLAFDYGSSAPSVCYIMARSPGIEINGQYFAKDSILILDELATADPNDLTKGLQYTIPHQAELIIEMCDRWNIEPRGVADDACFSQHGHSAGSIAQEFSRCGVHFRRAKKQDRKSGWERMRTLLSQAGEPDRPGLYIARNCSYFWETVPYIGRDKRDSEDLDTTGADHAADSVRYGILHEKRAPLQATMVNW